MYTSIISEKYFGEYGKMLLIFTKQQRTEFGDCSEGVKRKIKEVEWISFSIQYSLPSEF